MPGFYPIAGAPLAAGQINASATLASQTLSLSQSSVLVSDDDVIEVAGQALSLTFNGVSLTTTVDATLASQALTPTLSSVEIEVQPPAFDSQSLASTLSSVSLSAGATLTVASQSLNTSVNSLNFSTDVNIFITPLGPILYGDNWAIAAAPIGSLPEPCTYIATGMSLTESSVSLNLDAVLTAASQSMLFTENSVNLITDQNIVAPSQTIYTTLNGLRLWYDFPTEQPGNCPDHCDGLWTTIAYDEEVFGEDWAIASQAIGVLPQALPPIRKYPGSPWSNVPAQTTTTWTNIPT